MNNFIGKYLSLKCGSLGACQGRIVEVTPTHIKLDKACINGIPKQQPIEISVRSIENLSFLEMPAASATASRPKELSQVKVERPVPVRAPTGAEVRASPRKLDFQSTQTRKEKPRHRWTDRNEEAFGSPVDIFLVPDFDFDKNLALFDKKAVFDEINASKPDLVRFEKPQNYRCNENVLHSQAARFKQISVPQPGQQEYVTDTGLVVPSVSIKMRNRLLLMADSMGLTFARQGELIGRAATETSLHLLGGAHRLNPHNHHQCPSIAVLCGVHRAGLQAASTARQLASHGVRTTLLVEDSGAAPSSESSLMLKELTLLRDSGVHVTNNIQDLCVAPVDLIIMALSDANDVHRGQSSPASRWAQNNRAPVMALDPPALGTAGVTAKCCLVPALPLALDSSNGRVYLCNVGIPASCFKTAGIEYLPPFGPKFVIPLHHNDS